MPRINASRQITIHCSLVLIVVSLALVLYPQALQAQSQQDDLDVLATWRTYSDAPNLLYKHIASKAYVYLDQRRNKLSSISGKSGWSAYRDSVHVRLATAFGPLPEKTPLNARVTGTFEHQGISVEKILFESRPSFLVSAAFFKPAGAVGRLPAVLYVCGHTEEGFKADTYEKICLNLAQKGFAVLAIDPVGQGERVQYLDQQGNSSILGGTTNEHSYAGVLCLALGRTMAAVRLWDGIRAIDYLLERPDVDPSRIGVHGRSGGGTMSAYLGAMDSRIAAAAPECYISGFARIFQSIGPQDAEQNLLNQLKLGLDHGDFLFARAPRPSLISTTTRDFFSIQGARETFESLKPGFEALGQAGNISMIEDDAPHMSTRANRQRVYAFFMKEFGVAGPADDQDIEVVDSELMRISTTGQVVTSGSRTIHDVISQDAAPLFARLEHSRRNLHDHKRIVAEKALILSGVDLDSGPGEVVFRGGIQRVGYRIEKMILNTDSDLPLPCLALVPRHNKPVPAVLLLNPQGKLPEAARGSLADSLALQGFLVLLPDLPGTGELAANQQGDDSVISGINYNLLFGAQLIGRSVTGIQAGAVCSALEYLASRPDVNPSQISAIAKGTTGAPLLHASLRGNLLQAVALLDSPLSWESIFHSPHYDLAQGATVVPGALEYYDLPDLMGLFAPRKLLVVNPLDGEGKSAGEALRNRINGIGNQFYAKNVKAFAIRNSNGKSISSMLTGWLK
jgi:dienelactone hydrolase